MQFVRRLRMEVRTDRLPGVVLPDGFRFAPWRAGRLDDHARCKFEAFADAADLDLFPTLATVAGCRALMADIAAQPRFLPGATWLLVRDDDRVDAGFDPAVGTVQGLGGGRWTGAIQNVGVVPEFRGLGLGRALVLRSLHGFRVAGYRRVWLEVTAENAAAVRLYRGLGFRATKTLYKPLRAGVLRVA